MASKIAWTEGTWNPITGCSKISEGCKNCYAEKMAKRLRGRHGYDQNAPFAITIHSSKKWEEPLHWKKPRRIFVCSMGDLFHEDVPDGAILNVMRMVRNCPHHTFQVLTKRPARMCNWFKQWSDIQEVDGEPKLARGPEAVRKAHGCGRAMLFADMIEGWGKPPGGAAYPLYDWLEGMCTWPTTFPNLWLGTSCENQTRYNERVPDLLEISAAVRFVSLEPLIGWVGLGRQLKHLDWVIVGAESIGNRPGRECKLEWIVEIVRLCEEANVPVFVKQVHLRNNGRLVLSKKMDEWPQEIRVQEYPKEPNDGTD